MSLRRRVAAPAAPAPMRKPPAPTAAGRVSFAMPNLSGLSLKAPPPARPSMPHRRGRATGVNGLVDYDSTTDEDDEEEGGAVAPPPRPARPPSTTPARPPSTMPSTPGSSGAGPSDAAPKKRARGARWTGPPKATKQLRDKLKQQELLLLTPDQLLKFGANDDDVIREIEARVMDAFKKAKVKYDLAKKEQGDAVKAAGLARQASRESDEADEALAQAGKKVKKARVELTAAENAAEAAAKEQERALAKADKEAQKERDRLDRQITDEVTRFLYNKRGGLLAEVEKMVAQEKKEETAKIERQRQAAVAAAVAQQAEAARVAEEKKEEEALARQQAKVQEDEAEQRRAAALLQQEAAAKLQQTANEAKKAADEKCGDAIKYLHELRAQLVDILKTWQGARLSYEENCIEGVDHEARKQQAEADEEFAPPMLESPPLPTWIREMENALTIFARKMEEKNGRPNWNEPDIYGKTHADYLKEFEEAFPDEDDDPMDGGGGGGGDGGGDDGDDDDDGRIEGEDEEEEDPIVHVKFLMDRPIQVPANATRETRATIEKPYLDTMLEVVHAVLYKWKMQQPDAQVATTGLQTALVNTYPHLAAYFEEGSLNEIIVSITFDDEMLEFMNTYARAGHRAAWRKLTEEGVQAKQTLTLAFYAGAKARRDKTMIDEEPESSEVDAPSEEEDGEEDDDDDDGNGGGGGDLLLGPDGRPTPEAMEMAEALMDDPNAQPALVAASREFAKRAANKKIWDKTGIAELDGADVLERWMLRVVKKQEDLEDFNRSYFGGRKFQIADIVNAGEMVVTPEQARLLTERYGEKWRAMLNKRHAILALLNQVTLENRPKPWGERLKDLIDQAALLPRGTLDREKEYIMKQYDLPDEEWLYSDSLTDEQKYKFLKKARERLGAPSDAGDGKGIDEKDSEDEDSDGEGEGGAVSSKAKGKMKAK